MRIAPRTLGWTAVAVAAVAGLLALNRPLEPAGLVPRPDPAGSYADAAARCEWLQSMDGAYVNRQCLTRALLHGARTPRAVVLLHGLTNCPHQFAALADSLYARGCNVLVPRAPFHGYLDRMTPELVRLTALDLARAADQAVDIADGLGDTVVVAGLSTGGLQAAWAAQFRGDVRRAVLISPVFGVGPVPAPLTPAFTRAALTCPNVYLWWDPRVRAGFLGPLCVYPRYPTRAVGQILKFGFAIQAAAGRARPAACEISVVTSASDLAVSRAMTSRVVARWRGHGAAVRTFEFGRELGVGHDMVDPEQPYARTERVYPVLIREILGR